MVSRRSATSADQLEIEFRLRGKAGRVVASSFENQDPDRWGYPFLAPPHNDVPARGFPVCEARVGYEGEGYAALVGWVQIVRSTAAAGDARAGYLVDQPPLFAASGIPFSYFDPRVAFFDAPSMPSRQGELQWQADCFLCSCLGAVIRPVVAALLGFSWGYELHDGGVQLRDLAKLAPSAWNRHLSLLRRHCPAWTFLEGFHVEAPPGEPG